MTHHKAHKTLALSFIAALTIAGCAGTKDEPAQPPASSTTPESSTTTLQSTTRHAQFQCEGGEQVQISYIEQGSSIQNNRAVLVYGEQKIAMRQVADAALPQYVAVDKENSYRWSEDAQGVGTLAFRAAAATAAEVAMLTECRPAQ